jgi:hypothetical protein
LSPSSLVADDDAAAGVAGELAAAAISAAGDGNAVAGDVNIYTFCATALCQHKSIASHYKCCKHCELLEPTPH